MADLGIRIYGDPILRQVASPVARFASELRQLADAMVEIMYEERGIGLAAPQVGVSKRMIVVLQMEDVDDTEASPLVLVNPSVISTSNEAWEFEEGCLSIPGINAPVVRAKEVEVEYQDLDGQNHRIKDDGFFGRILLHEIDHLNGKLFIDYLSSAQKSLIKTKLKALKSGQLPP